MTVDARYGTRLPTVTITERGKWNRSAPPFSITVHLLGAIARKFPSFPDVVVEINGSPSEQKRVGGRIDVLELRVIDPGGWPPPDCGAIAAGTPVDAAATGHRPTGVVNSLA